ncbi:MAG: DUF2304 domain-containing protein [Tissierellia bacterium]|jgi:hypothetical protein|nr:DUF2304 domain-containing protein [Tissierellia bacterium]MDD4088552.1 DUF2304 domain-containing protein [Tissierellia bacterium]
MNLLTKIWIIALSVGIIIYLFEKIRKQKYIVKFSIPWFFTFITIILLAIFPNLIDKIAIVLGIKEPTNAIFFIAIGILVNNIIKLSFSMSESKKQSIRMAQEIALLKKGVIGVNDEISDGYKVLQEIILLGNNKNMDNNNDEDNK